MTAIRLVGRGLLETASVLFPGLVRGLMTVMAAMRGGVIQVAIVMPLFPAVPWVSIAVVRVAMIRVPWPLPIDRGRLAVRRLIAVIAARGRGRRLRNIRCSVQQLVEHSFGDQRYRVIPVVVRRKRVLDAAGSQQFSAVAEFAAHIERGVAVGQNFTTQLRRSDAGDGLQLVIVGKLLA